MNFHSIKFKITCWYTFIIIFVIIVMLAGVTWHSEIHSEGVIKAELLDEIEDLQEDILRYPNYFPMENLTAYYDDGVMLSVYNEAGEMLNGILPDEFPKDVPLVQDSMKKERIGTDSWFISDRQVQLSDGEVLWIRGIHSYSALVMTYQQMTLLLVILCPLLALFTAFVGYRMISHSLRPIHTLITASNEITSSGKLSNRIPMPEARDEFYELSETFNRMFRQLEENFLRERQFSSDAAHELRTPVAVILCHCEYCLEELELSKEVRAEIQIIREKCQRMSKLVSELLVISRGEREISGIQREAVDLVFLAETVAEELEEQAKEKKICIEIQNHLEDPVIFGDMSKLTRLFINLMENAIAYGKEQGYLRICMEAEGRQVVLRFQDNGIGISLGDQERIWDRFYRVDSSRSQKEGFGLGLFLVRQIVESHGGQITLESFPGKGSTFVIRLPRSIPAESQEKGSSLA